MEVDYPKRTPLQVDASIASSLDIGKVCLCDTNHRLYHKDPCPEGEKDYSKVVIRNQMDMDKEREYGSERKMSGKPRWDNWHVRLPNPKDQRRAIDLFQRSGAETKSDFVRGRILGESFKVITVDKSAVEYYRKLSELTAQIHKIGVLYNQAVRALNSYHGVKTARIMLEKMERLSQQIIELQQQTISLTIDYRKK